MYKSLFLLLKLCCSREWSVVLKTFWETWVWCVYTSNTCLWGCIPQVFRKAGSRHKGKQGSEESWFIWWWWTRFTLIAFVYSENSYSWGFSEPNVVNGKSLTVVKYKSFWERFRSMRSLSVRSRICPESCSGQEEISGGMWHMCNEWDQLPK